MDGDRIRRIVADAHEQIEAGEILAGTLNGLDQLAQAAAAAAFLECADANRRTRARAVAIGGDNFARLVREQFQLHAWHHLTAAQVAELGRYAGRRFRTRLLDLYATARNGGRG